MKKIFTFLAAFMLSVSLLAQAPQSFNYQAVVRDASGNVISSTMVGMKISILQGSVSGSAVCVEEFTPTTNSFGLVTLSIGSLNTTDFAAIDWSDGPYFVKVELDPAGGTSYTEMGTTQLLSVPFALHSQTVENTDDADPDPSNEIQAISVNNDTLYLSNGGAVYLGYLLDNTDTQKLVLNDYYLGITNGNEIELPSVWSRFGTDISYDSGTVTISGIKGNIQLNLPDAFGAGGHNLIIGDDSYLTDIDMYNTLGIFGITDSTIGAIKLGSDGPVISGSNTNLSVNKEMDLNNQKVVNLADPVNNQDAATKAYVDGLKNIIYEEMLDAGLNGIVNDIDGNLYKTIKIGDQVWMAENLKTTHYADGTPLVDGTDSVDLTGDYVTKYYFYYGDDSATYAHTYGALYTWAGAMNGASSSDAIPSGMQGVCPTGWHMPSDGEWQQMVDYLGGLTVAGGKLKETGIIHWKDPNNATNESGYTALPGGYRGYTGNYFYITEQGDFWSATESVETKAWHRYMYYSTVPIGRIDYGKNVGISVRCVRD